MKLKSYARLMLRHLLAAALLGSVMPGFAQLTSSRPVTIVAPFPSGGTPDLAARLLGESMSAALQRPFLVDPKPGANGSIGTAHVAQSVPDGHTLLISTSGSLWQSRVLYRKLPFNADKELVPIALFPSGALAFAVPDKLPVKNPKEFVELARKQPTNIGTYAPASWPHLITDTWNQTLGLAIVPVHYKGESPMYLDLSSGLVQGAVGSVQGLLPHLQRNAVRAIAMTGMSRSPKLPDVPTFAEQGFNHPIFRMEGWLPMCAPAGTPVAILEQINAAIREAYASAPKIRDMHQFYGIPTGPTHTLAEAAKQWADDAPQWIAAATKLGITLD